jgi:RNA polymerase sigma factor (sigma-70 family)
MRGTIALLAVAELVATSGPASARARTAGHSERLAARARHGDRAARTALVEEHMGLVQSLAFRYRDLGLPVEDLVQEGAIGLLAAVDRYDSRRGASFSTYAFWRVRAAITHALTAQGQMVRLPRPLLERRREIAQTRQHLAATGRDPSVDELARATTLPPVAVAEALAPANAASLDLPAVDGTMVRELVATDATTSPEAQLASSEQLRVLRGAVRHLRGRKRTIVSRHFGLAGTPETLTAIAEDLHLSPERTRSLEDEALRELAGELEPAVGA